MFNLYTRNGLSRSGEDRARVGRSARRRLSRPCRQTLSAKFHFDCALPSLPPLSQSDGRNEVDGVTGLESQPLEVVEAQFDEKTRVGRFVVFDEVVLKTGLFAFCQKSRKVNPASSNVCHCPAVCHVLEVAEREAPWMGLEVIEGVATPFLLFPIGRSRTRRDRGRCSSTKHRTAPDCRSDRTRNRGCGTRNGAQHSCRPGLPHCREPPGPGTGRWRSGLRAGAARKDVAINCSCGLDHGIGIFLDCLPGEVGRGRLQPEPIKDVSNLLRLPPVVVVELHLMEADLCDGF